MTSIFWSLPRFQTPSHWIRVSRQHWEALGGSLEMLEEENGTFLVK